MGIADFMRVFQINQKTLIIISDYQGFAYLLMLSHKNTFIIDLYLLNLL